MQIIFKSRESQSYLKLFLALLMVNSSSGKPTVEFQNANFHSFGVLKGNMVPADIINISSRWYLNYTILMKEGEYPGRGQYDTQEPPWYNSSDVHSTRERYVRFFSKLTINRKLNAKHGLRLHQNRLFLWMLGAASKPMKQVSHSRTLLNKWWTVTLSYFYVMIYYEQKISSWSSRQRTALTETRRHWRCPWVFEFYWSYPQLKPGHSECT